MKPLAFVLIVFVWKMFLFSSHFGNMFFILLKGFNMISNFRFLALMLVVETYVKVSFLFTNPLSFLCNEPLFMIEDYCKSKNLS